jgi:predicted alpha/beta superfamily hydrolase
MLQKGLLLLVLIITTTLSAQKTPDIQRTPFNIGETFTFKSEILNEDRTINIYLPAGYHPDSAATYPVIYLLDGTADEDFIHIAGIVQFTNYPWVNILPKSIVVGIANIDRKRDFTYPTTIEKDKKDFPTTGGSAKFIDFLSKELQPLIKKTYPTNGTKTLIGQSLGGLVATEILFKQPHLFDNYIIVSPSLWWDNQSLLEHLYSLHISKVGFLKKKSIYIAVGKEGKIMEKDAKTLFKEVRHLTNTDVTFEYFKGSNHANILHLAVYNAFEKLFAPKN